MRRPALIIIDMLNDFLDRWAPASKEELIGSINALVRLMRKYGYPIIWVRQEFETDLSDAFLEMKSRKIYVTIKGTRGAQIAPELEVGPQDRVVIKKRYSAFYETSLDEMLSEIAPDALIIAGINTHACIRTTVIDAYERDWQIVLAVDCIDSYDREHHDISLAYMRDKIASVMTNAELRSEMESYLEDAGGADEA